MNIVELTFIYCILYLFIYWFDKIYGIMAYDWM